MWKHWNSRLEEIISSKLFHHKWELTGSTNWPRACARAGGHACASRVVTSPLLQFARGQPGLVCPLPVPRSNYARKMADKYGPVMQQDACGTGCASCFRHRDKPLESWQATCDKHVACHTSSVRVKLSCHGYTQLLCEKKTTARETSRFIIVCLLSCYDCCLKEGII